MGWFGNKKVTTTKTLEDFPNNWTGQDIIDLSEDLRSNGITVNLEGSEGMPKYFSFCSGDACNLYKVGLSHDQTNEEAATQADLI